ncbi:hypothetical protein JCGZ_03763 [Jatropha curcas]|uniref:Uncharacterized protein n=1 Tax=Jatropha curcas TaxID=180498 RepID=A0A067KZK5_JATCU|nr:hypothetical protein JCGZ_03763 [Jatropha curcas]
MTEICSTVPNPILPALAWPELERIVAVEVARGVRRCTPPALDGFRWKAAKKRRVDCPMQQIAISAPRIVAPVETEEGKRERKGSELCRRRERLESPESRVESCNAISQTKRSRSSSYDNCSRCPSLKWQREGERAATAARGDGGGRWLQVTGKTKWKGEGL